MDENDDEDSNMIMIDDIRTMSDFKMCSFSGFKKTQVVKQLHDNLVAQNVASSCYWTFELLCAGHFKDAIEQHILVYASHIHLSRPSIAIYLARKISQFNDIVQSEGELTLMLRNNNTIRKLFCELSCVLCFATQHHAIEIIKITHVDFLPQTIIDKTKAPSEKYAGKYLDDMYDPITLFPAINELVYHLTVTKSVKDGCYCVEWIMQFAFISHKNKHKLVAKTRYFEGVNVESKYQQDVVWIIWNILISLSKSNTLCHRFIKSLLSIYTYRYTATSYKKLRSLLYFSIDIVCNMSNEFNITIIDNDKKPIVDNIIGNINNLIAELTTNQQKTHTDYLKEL